MSKKTNEWQESTITARAGVDQDPVHGAVAPPLYLTSNYAFAGYGEPRKYDYARSGNPTRDMLGQAIADLEHGFHSVITTSGMGALHLVVQLLGADDLILAPHDCYGGTFRLLNSSAEAGRFKVKFVDLTDTDALETYFAEKPKMVLIETPSNPLLRITDIKAVVAAAKSCGAICVADNTFLSPVLQKPLDLGCDVVVHSTTKYLNGHGDIVGGAVVSRTQEMHEKLAWWGNCIGITAASFDCYMTLRGMRSLTPRVEYQMASAMEIAEFLNQHPAVDKVHYPGLESHPGHAVAKEQQSGFGAMLSFELKADQDTCRQFVEGLSLQEDSLFTLAESLGGFESLIAHPPTMTHAAMAPEARVKAGIGDTLLRLSIGLENVIDLKAALANALDSIEINKAA